MLTGILQFDQMHIDLSNRSDFIPIYELDTELDLGRIRRGLHGAFVTGMACQQERFLFQTIGSGHFGLAYVLIAETPPPPPPPQVCRKVHFISLRMPVGAFDFIA